MIMEILYVVTLIAGVALWRYYRNRLNKLESEFIDYQIVTGEQFSILIKDIIKLQGTKKKKKQKNK